MSSLINKVLKVWYYLFGLIVGITLFYVGLIRIESGIEILRALGEDFHFFVHYVEVGVLYIKISLLILIVLAVAITYSLANKK